MKSKANIFQEIVKQLREDHRLMTMHLLSELRELEKPFQGMRFVFKTPRVKNRTYRIHGLEFKDFSILPINSRKRKSTGLLGLRNNASFFGYALNEITLNFVKIQEDGLDQELLKIERTLHEKFSNKTRYLFTSAEVDMAANRIIDAEADFFIASRGYQVSRLSNDSRHSGKIHGISWNQKMSDIDIRVSSGQGGFEQIIDNETHIVNIWG